MTAVAERPSSWEGGIHPIGAISGRPAVAASSTPRVRSHRRSGVERLELVAAGIGGGLVALAFVWIFEKGISRG